jgi:hypothetical protein
VVCAIAADNADNGWLGVTDVGLVATDRFECDAIIYCVRGASRRSFKYFNTTLLLLSQNPLTVLALQQHTHHVLLLLLLLSYAFIASSATTLIPTPFSIAISLQ